MSGFHQSNPQESDDESRIYVTYEAATSDLRKKLIRQEKHLRIQYQLIRNAFNMIAITQVIIGAAITALGPSGGDHMLAITILGALNTSIAGLLALLKGRGLPERLRRNMIEIAKVSDFIQEKATLLRYGNSGVCNDGISLLLQEVYQAYHSAQQTIETNETDTYADGRISQASAVATEANRSSSQIPLTSEKNGKARQMDEEMGTVSTN
ncbi:hypothetical protein N7490_005353 [Penicillium lividum]|nr:hypothetical protein N7490_005353 [Penicillium lividum]